MPNFQQAKIYKLYSLSQPVDFYVGSTALEYLSSRLSGHRASALKTPGHKAYALFNNLGWKTVVIELIEHYPCNSRDELFAREHHWWMELRPSLNSNVPGLTEDEKIAKRKAMFAANYQAHKEAKDKAKKINYDENWVERRANAAEKIVCECGGHYARSVKARHLGSTKHKNFVSAGGIAAPIADKRTSEKAMNAYIDSLLED